MEKLVKSSSEQTRRVRWPIKEVLTVSLSPSFYINSASEAATQFPSKLGWEESTAARQTRAPTFDRWFWWPPQSVRTTHPNTSRDTKSLLNNEKRWKWGWVEAWISKSLRSLKKQLQNPEGFPKTTSEKTSAPNYLSSNTLKLKIQSVYFYLISIFEPQLLPWSWIRGIGQ